MAKGYALTIGLNSVNPSHYDGWSGELLACEADAKDMAEIAKSKGFSVKTLLTRSATRKNVIKELSKAATTLKSADIFMLSYSGHGGQVPDRNKDEDDYQDETWCLYDGELIDVFLRRHVQRSFHRNAPAGLERWQIEYLPEILQGHRETHAPGADTELLLGRNAQQEV